MPHVMKKLVNDNGNSDAKVVAEFGFSSLGLDALYQRRNDVMKYHLPCFAPRVVRVVGS